MKLGGYYNCWRNFRWCMQGVQFPFEIVGDLQQYDSLLGDAAVALKSRWPSTMAQVSCFVDIVLELLNN